MADSETKEKPIIRPRQDHPDHASLSSVEEDYLSEEETPPDPSTIMGNVLFQVLSSVFTSVDIHGQPCNIVDAILETKRSIDKQTKYLKEIKISLDTINGSSTRWRSSYFYNYL